MRCLTNEECEAWRDEHSRRRQWKRQVTCHTPLKRLPWFTSELTKLLMPFDQALLILDEVVFNVPPALESIRRAAGETRSVRETPGFLFEGDPHAFTLALDAALSGWIDLRVLLSPKKHALKADHDEYTTFFSMSPGKIADVKSAMSAGNVKLVDWTANDP
jgi:hypothetical protein